MRFENVAQVLAGDGFSDDEDAPFLGAAGALAANQVRVRLVFPCVGVVEEAPLNFGVVRQLWANNFEQDVAASALVAGQKHLRRATFRQLSEHLEFLHEEKRA